jgi:hypothetical protein
MKYYKIFEEEEKHHGLQYHDGFVEDTIPWDPSGSCKPGGIHFASKDIFAFLWIGPWLREVTIPEDTPVLIETTVGFETFKAPRVILGPREEITSETIKRLIKEGANVNAGNGMALWQAVFKNDLPMVRYLIESGANVNVCEGDVLCVAVYRNHISIVKALVRAGTTEGLERAIRIAVLCNYSEVTKYLRSIFPSQDKC